MIEKPKPARIILDRPQLFPRGWCWRDEWVTNHDSSYGLFAKFALLNVMTAREIARIFANSTSGRKSAIIAFPDVDLRDSKMFDLVAMSRIMRIEMRAIQQSFLVELLPNSQRKSITYLRWCTKCAAVGFHTPIFQLAIVSDCPIHGMPLQSRCRKCNAQVPYRYRHEVINSPFACSSCGTAFAKSFQGLNTRSFRTKARDYSALANVIKLLVFEDEILPVKIELNRQRKSLGFGEIAIAPADWRKKESEYTGFVIQVLHALMVEQDVAQYPIPLEEIVEIKHGTKALPLVRVELRKRSRIKRRLPETSSSLEKHSWDQRLHSLYSVYNAIRRHLWRKIVRDHQSCVTSAAHHCWWHMEGEVTSHICPIAEAFLRWRMIWEGCGVPRQLYEPLSKPPYGIMGWQAEAAPICPAGWSAPAEQWVSDHVFADACLSSFFDWLQIAIDNQSTKSVTWAKYAVTGKFERYWAITGHDSWNRPVKIYSGRPQILNPLLQLSSFEASRLHKLAHRTQLATIRR